MKEGKGYQSVEISTPEQRHRTRAVTDRQQRRVKKWRGSEVPFGLRRPFDACKHVYMGLPIFN